MSDTPISDTAARAGAYYLEGDYSATCGKQIVHLEDMRKLERELNAEKAKSHRLRDALEPLVDALNYEFAGVSTLSLDDDVSVSGGEDGESKITFGMIRKAEAALAETPAGEDAKEPPKWCPDRCPITLRPFFMWIEKDGVQVPTYGGPYDSYTIPEPQIPPAGEKLELHEIQCICERYDHDEDGWVEGGEDPAIRIIKESKLVEMEDRLKNTIPREDVIPLVEALNHFADNLDASGNHACKSLDLAESALATFTSKYGNIQNDAQNATPDGAAVIAKERQCQKEIEGGNLDCYHRLPIESPAGEVSETKYQVMQCVPNDHPLMIAWEKYKSCEGFLNTKKWALHEEHVEGSLWAAFEAGFNSVSAYIPREDVLPLVIALKESVTAAYKTGKNLQDIYDKHLKWHGLPFIHNEVRESVNKVVSPALETFTAKHGEVKG